MFQHKLHQEFAFELKLTFLINNLFIYITVIAVRVMSFSDRAFRIGTLKFAPIFSVYTSSFLLWVTLTTSMLLIVSHSDNDIMLPNNQTFLQSLSWDLVLESKSRVKYSAAITAISPHLRSNSHSLLINAKEERLALVRNATELEKHR